MDDPATPNEQPPYLDKCKDMNVDELYEFFEDSLEKRSDLGFDAEIPRSEEEFRSLWAMLREKVYTLRVPPKPLLYEPSERLKAKRVKRERTLSFLNEADKTVIRQTEHSLLKLEREIAELEAKRGRIMQPASSFTSVLSLPTTGSLKS